MFLIFKDSRLTLLIVANYVVSSTVLKGRGVVFFEQLKSNGKSQLSNNNKGHLFRRIHRWTCRFVAVSAARQAQCRSGERRSCRQPAWTTFRRRDQVCSSLMHFIRKPSSYAEGSLSRWSVQLS